jgi:hypothetical protein
MDSTNVPSKRPSSVSDSIAAVGSSLTANWVPLDIKKIQEQCTHRSSGACITADKKFLLSNDTAFFFPKEMELRLCREEREELRREREEERCERDEERRRCDEERNEDRRHREEELLELWRKESQQQQQMAMMMQLLGMTAMMAYLGVKQPKPDDK